MIHSDGTVKFRQDRQAGQWSIPIEKIKELDELIIRTKYFTIRRNPSFPGRTCAPFCTTVVTMKNKKRRTIKQDMINDRFPPALTEFRQTVAEIAGIVQYVGLGWLIEEEEEEQEGE